MLYKFDELFLLLSQMKKVGKEGLQWGMLEMFLVLMLCSLKCFHQKKPKHLRFVFEREPNFMKDFSGATAGIYTGVNYGMARIRRRADWVSLLLCFLYLFYHHHHHHHLSGVLFCFFYEKGKRKRPKMPEFLSIS